MASICTITKMNQMETQQLLLSIQQEITQIKKAILSPSVTNLVSDKWIPRNEVMNFFNYAPTQMASLENAGDIIVAKIGKRKFVLRESITKLLDNSIQNINPSNE